jgi:serine/threonine protein kinase
VFGIVREGYYQKSKEKVAIKIVIKNDLYPKNLELLRNEIENLKICQHPNIIKIYDTIENRNYIYIITEFCSGGDLLSYMEKRNYKISEERCAAIIHKLSTSLYYLNHYGIIHRDLKPENIMMVDDSDDSDIRLVDFGLSKMIGPYEKCDEPYGTIVK